MHPVCVWSSAISHLLNLTQSQPPSQRSCDRVVWPLEPYSRTSSIKAMIVASKVHSLDVSTVTLLCPIVISFKPCCLWKPSRLRFNLKIQYGLPFTQQLTLNHNANNTWLALTCKHPPPTSHSCVNHLGASTWNSQAYAASRTNHLPIMQKPVANTTHQTSIKTRVVIQTLQLTDL